jgi:hypothetical protein
VIEWPDADAYRAWARIPDAVDDAAIGYALAAVRAAVVARCPVLVGDTWPDQTQCPEDVAQAVLLWTNRVLARRNSPDGVVGVADLGIANVARMDVDIQRMLSPWLAVVLA